MLLLTIRYGAALGPNPVYLRHPPPDHYTLSSSLFLIILLGHTGDPLQIRSIKLPPQPPGGAPWIFKRALSDITTINLA
jgi:hypothetical protein